MGKRVIRFETRATLPFSPDEVWRALAHVAGWPQWTDQLRPLTPDAAAAEPGQVLRISSKMAAWPWSPVQHVPLTVRIEAAEPGRRLVWRGRFAGVDGRHGFELQPARSDEGAHETGATPEGPRCELVQWEELRGGMTYVLQLAGIWTNLKRAFPVLLRELRSHLARQRLPKEPLHAIQAGGATFRYLDVGNGDPVVMLHGYPQNHDCWRHQIAALRSRFRVIAPDLPGWGASDRRLDLHYDYDAEVGRLIEFFDGLGLRNVHLLAHDYGGYLALGLARARPDLVNRLVVLNSRAHGTFKARWKLLFVPTLRWLSQIPALGRLAKWMPGGRLHRLFLRRELREGIFDGPAAKSYLGHLTPGSHGTKWLLRFFAPGRGYSFVPQPSLRTGHAEGLRNLVVWGTEDTFLSSHLARELTEGLPHCTLKWLPGVGHYVMEEAPDEVTAALRGFLQD